jgi:hypothetical protein
MSDGQRFRFFYKGKAYLIPKEYIDEEHPGGGDEIWPWVNKDMTDAFDDADHSLDALEMLEEYLDEDYVPDEAAAAAEEKEEEREKEESAAKVTATTSVFAAAAGAASAAKNDISRAAESAAAQAAAPAVAAASAPGKAEGQKFAVPVVVIATAVAVLAVSAATILTRLKKKR